MNPAQRGPVIAVLDVGYILKEHAGLKAWKTHLENEAQRAEALFIEDRDEIRQMGDQLKQMDPGTPRYKELEVQATKKAADLQLRLQLQRKEFAEKQAKIFHSVYQELRQEVGNYASRFGIAMVLRFDGEPAASDQLDEVGRSLSQQVVWHAQPLDITADILGILNQKYSRAAETAARPGGAGRAGVPAPR
jgi:Skp family chaperone for outer membrane proteins